LKNINASSKYLKNESAIKKFWFSEAFSLYISLQESERIEIIKISNINNI
jgi:hypothetical protein